MPTNLYIIDDVGTNGESYDVLVRATHEDEAVQCVREHYRNSEDFHHGRIRAMSDLPTITGIQGFMSRRQQ